MKKIVMNFLTKIGVVKLYRLLLESYYNIACTRFECSVGDILLQRDIIQTNQFLLTSRLLDVEAYLSGADKSFPFQNAISYKTYGNNHNEELGNSRFKALIESYVREGYHFDSFVTCDRNMNLLDGNHRMGLHIYEGLDTISVRRIKRKIPFQYGIDNYYQLGLPSSFIEQILDRYSQIQQWLIEEGMTFCAYIYGEGIDMLLKDLNRLCKVLKVLVCNDNQGLLVQFSMPDPQYTIKEGGLVSERVLEIERIINGRIKGAVTFQISKNCFEGQRIYREYLLKEK